MGDRSCEDLDIALSSKDYNDVYYDEEDTEGEYEDEEMIDDDGGGGSEGKSDELACPFCVEDFDVLELCCHIDADHRMEVKPGICPICVTKVGINMASHVITQHENVLKALCYKRHRSARSRAAISLLRKDLQEKHLSSLKESYTTASSSDGAADSKLLSFVYNPQPATRPESVLAARSTDAVSSGKSLGNSSSERIPESLATDGDQEAARRCEFVHGLLFSTILDDL